MITAISVSLNRRAYCRYEPNYSTVKGAIRLTGATISDQVIIRLEKTMKNGTLLLDTTTLTVSDVNKPLPIAFDLSSYMDDDLSLIRASDSFDDYQVRATSGAVEGKAAFSVVLTPVEVMRDSYAGGLPLQAAESLVVFQQPRTVVGVEIEEVGPASKAGGKVLVWVVASKTLSWSGGTPVLIDMFEFASYRLPEASGLGYIEVKINPFSLALTDKTESIIIEARGLGDNDIIRELIAKRTYLETEMGAFIEPTHVVTSEIATEHPEILYHYMIDPSNYYRQPHAQYYNFRTTKRPIRRVIRAEGWFNSDRVVRLDENWRVESRPGGIVTLLPSGAAIQNWTLSTVGISAVLVNRTYIPNFWQVEMWTGLLEASSDLRDWVAKRAAMTLLARAGAARFPGISSYSLSRDGVSESRSINPLGPYAALIDRYGAETGLDKQGNETMIPAFTRKYVGYAMVTL